MIKFAKYIKSTWCTVWCVFKYLQATWVKHTHTRPQNICFPDEESTVLALNPYYRKKNKTKQILIQKLTLKWHLLWIIAGCWPVCIKALWNGADVSQWPSNLICRGGKKKQQERRWPDAGGGGGLGMFSRGWWAWKPEDPGYLLLLAAPRTKRGLNTFFFFPVWLQTMRGFESTHDSHGNWFQVPTIKWNWCFFFKKNGSKLKHTGSVERDHF